MANTVVRVNVKYVGIGQFFFVFFLNSLFTTKC